VFPIVVLCCVVDVTAICIIVVVAFVEQRMPLEFIVVLDGYCRIRWECS